MTALVAVAKNIKNAVILNLVNTITMTKTNRGLSSRIKEQIQKANRILLHLHPGPDGDSVGSVLAFYHVLKQFKKNVEIIGGDSPLPDFLSHLPGFKHIKPQTYFQTELDRFDLFIILDTAGINMVSSLNTVVFPPHLKTIVIDHHSTNPGFADINLIDTTSPATAQIIYSLFSSWNIKIDKKIAACLLTGIYTDSQFKYEQTSWKTFKITSKLSRIYPQFPALFSKIDNNNTPQAIRLVGLLLSSTETYLEKHLAIASISYQQLRKNHLSKSDGSGISTANILKSVIGWDIAVTLFEVRPGVVKASFRTRQPQKYNMAKIAVTTGRGGGHPAAAGATLNHTLEPAKREIISIVHRLYPHLGKK